MGLSTIMTLLGGDGASRAALRTAVAVGRRFEAYVEALHVRPTVESVVPVVAEGMTVKTIGRLREGAEAGSEERAQQAYRLFQDLAVEEALPLTRVEAEPVPGRFALAWRDVTGVESREVAERGRLFDLLVLPRPEGGRGARPAESSEAVLEAALFQSARPVLVAAPEVPATLGKRILLAWNDTPEAARAIWAALPFLEQAEQIIVLTIDETRPDRDSAELARALARHGIAAEARTPKRGKGPVGAQLLAQAEEHGCDLLVMGAYGHSRLQEIILGGATRHVLAHAQLPLLMAH